MMTIITVIIIMICVSVHGLDIVMNCETVRDGDVSSFRGKLYKENISSVCDMLVPEKVTFQLTYPSTFTEDLCKQFFSPCNNTVNAQGCKCVSDGTDAYTFEFNFRFNKSKHEGSTLSLTADCFGNGNNRLTTSDPCDLKEGTASSSLSLSVCLSVCLSLSLPPPPPPPPHNPPTYTLLL